MPWRTCNNWWNTAACVNPYERDALNCWGVWDHKLNGTVKVCSLAGANLTTSQLTDPVKEFWEYVNIKLILFFTGVDFHIFLFRQGDELCKFLVASIKLAAFDGNWRPPFSSYGSCAIFAFGKVSNGLAKLSILPHCFHISC